MNGRKVGDLVIHIMYCIVARRIQEFERNKDMNLELEERKPPKKPRRLAFQPVSWPNSWKRWLAGRCDVEVGQEEQIIAKGATVASIRLDCR